MSIYELINSGEWQTDDDGERVYVASRTIGSSNAREDGTKPEDTIIYDQEPVVDTSKPNISGDGSYFDEGTGTLVVPDPENMSDYTSRYLAAQIRAQEKAKLGINTNRYDEATAQEVLTGSVVVPSELGYDPAQVYRLIHHAENDEAFQEHLSTVDTAQLREIERTLTPEQKTLINRIHKQFGNTLSENNSNPGLLDRHSLLAFASYYNILPHREQQETQPSATTGIHPSVRLQGAWGVDDQEYNRRLGFVKELVSMAPKEDWEKYSTVEKIYEVWDNFASGRYDEELKKMGKSDLISKRYEEY